MSEHLLVDDPAEPRPPRPRGRRTTLVVVALTALVVAAGVLLALDRDPDRLPPEPVGVRNGVIVGRLDLRPTVLSGRMALPRDMRRETTLQFTRDGTELVYVDRRGRVVAWDVLAGIPRVLARCPRRSWCHPTLSPDGRTLAVQAAGKRLRTVLVDVATGDQRPFPSDHDGAVSWSPDGTRLAVIDRSGLWVVATTTGESTRIAGTGRGDLYGEPAWSPDGARIAYVEGRPVGHRPRAAPRQRFGLVAVDADGSDREDVLELGVCVCWTEPVPDVAWSPDGTRLAVTDLARGGTYTYALDGTDPVWISAPANELAWQPVIG